MMTLSIMTSSIIAKYRVVNIVVLSVIMLSVIMLSVIMLSVAMLNVVAPFLSAKTALSIILKNFYQLFLSFSCFDENATSNAQWSLS
jgi:hypothetical protein